MNIFSGGMDRIELTVDLARQRMKTVEDQADIWMIGAADDFPGIAMMC